MTRFMVLVLIILLPLMAAPQISSQGIYLPVGSTQVLKSTVLLPALPTQLQALPDNTVFQAAYTACMNPTPPATSPGNQLCTNNGNQAAATDAQKRVDTAIMALYNQANSGCTAAPGQCPGDSILRTANLYIKLP